MQVGASTGQVNKMRVKTSRKLLFCLDVPPREVDPCIRHQWRRARHMQVARACVVLFTERNGNFIDV